MKRKSDIGKFGIILVLIFVSTILITDGYPQNKSFPVLKGPYLGQKPPGMKPEVFAPGIVSTKEFREYSGTFNPDGKEYYFFRFADGAGMMVSRLTDEGWTAPEPANFNTEHIDNEPHITHDGRYMFFNSSRPVPGREGERMGTQIWYMEREGDSWNEPRHLQMGMFVTTSWDGTIYLNGGIMKLVDGKLVSVEKILGESAHAPEGFKRGNHFSIAPDGSCFIFDTQKIGTEWDAEQFLFVCFRMKDGSWSEAYDLGKQLNVPGGMMLATFSWDGRYLFFCSPWDIYWVDARIIDTVKPKE